MKHFMTRISTAVLLGLLLTGFAMAGGSETILVELDHDETGLVSADLSDLAVGDAETIVTESGKTVDLLRTEDGIEIYVNGELLEMPHLAHDAPHGQHSWVDDCEDGADCEQRRMMVFVGEGDHELVDVEHEVHKVIRIEDGNIEISGDDHDEIIEILHEEEIDIEIDGEQEGGQRKVIIIRKHAEEDEI